MKSSTSSSTLRIPLLIKDQNSFPNVGTRRLISCQKTRKIFKKLFSKLSLSTKTQNQSQNGCSLQYLSLYLHFSFLYLCVSLTMQIMFIHSQMSNFQDLAEESQLDSKLLVLVKYMIPVVILE